VKIVTFTAGQYAAIEAAILNGALAARHAQLTELLKVNQNHLSICIGIEKEIRDLTLAAAAILDPKAVQ
jgi:hypothetical protein